MAVPPPHPLLRGEGIRWKNFLFGVCLILTFATSVRAAEAARPAAVRVPPIFWHEVDPEAQRSFSMALLLYWHLSDPSGRFRLLAPVYYESTTPDEELRILLPLHLRYKIKDQESVLWGPYFSKKSLRESTRFVFPLYYRSADAEGTATFLAPYFGLRTPRVDARVVFPLYWKLRQLERKRTYETLIPFYLRMENGEVPSRTWIAPAFWSYRDPQVSQGLLPPYYWRHTSSGTAEVGFPLYWHFRWQRPEGPKDVQVAAPWFRIRTDAGSLRGFAPLYWGRTKIEPTEASTGTRATEWDLLFPLYFSASKPDGTRKRMTPLFSRFENPDGRISGHAGPSFFSRDPWGGQTKGMLPLFYYREEPDFYKLRFLLLYVMRDAAGEHAQTSFFPLFRHRRDGDRRQLLVPGFYRDRDPLVSRGWLLSYFWSTEYQRSNGAIELVERKRFLLPLYWHAASPKERTTVVPPLAAFHSEENYRLAFVLPFYFNRAKEQSSFTVVPPLISLRTPDRNWTGLFFLMWKSRIKDRSAFTLLPLYRRAKFPGGGSLYLPGFYRLRDGDRTQGVLLNFLWDHRGKTQYDMFVPLYWNFRRPTWTARSVFPYYRVDTQGFHERGIFPIWAKTDPADVSTGAARHFLADSHRVLPFYFYRRLPDGYDLYLPLVLGRIERGLDADREPWVRGRMFLLNSWEKSKDRFVNRFDPVYHYTRTPDRKGFAVPTAPLPLWQYEKEGLRSEDGPTVRGAVFPYYWKTAKTFRRQFVLPLFYGRREFDETGATETYRVTWLLAYFSSRDPQEMRERTLVFPLYWRFADRDGSRTIVPPVWIDRGPDHRRHIVFPLWWSFARGSERTSVFFPLFMKASDSARHSSTLILPGYWRSRDPETSTVWAGPFFRRTRPARGESFTLALPVFWSVKAPDRSSRTVFPLLWQWRADDRAVTYLFPLYFSHRREHLRWKVAFPLFWKFTADQTEVRVIPPYFSIAQRAAGTKTSGVAPLWSYTENAPEDSTSLQILGGLVGVERKGDRRTLTLLYFLRI